MESWSKIYPTETRTLTRNAYYRYKPGLDMEWVVYPYQPTKTTMVSQTKSRSGTRLQAKPPKVVGKKHKKAKRQFQRLMPALPGACSLMVRDQVPVHVRAEIDFVGTRKLQHDMFFEVYGSALTAPTMPGFNSRAYSDAYGKCLAEYENRKADVLAMVAEAHETATQLSSFAPRLEKAFSDGCDGLMARVRGMKPRGAVGITPKAIAKAAANYWLEWSFGIKPLLADAQNTAEALAEISLRRNHPIKCKGVGFVRSINRTGYQVSLTPPGGFPGSATGNVDDCSTTYMKYRVGGHIVPSNVLTPLSTAGLTPSKALPAIWEIVPYSWLIDYFTNIGDLIEYYCAGRMDLSNAWQVTVRESARTIRTTPVSGGPYGLSYNRVSGSVGTNSVRQFEWIRGPWSPVMPSFSFTTPSGVTRVLNMAAVGVTNTADRTMRGLRV